jgi:hypothetical protein
MPTWRADHITGPGPGPPPAAIAAGPYASGPGSKASRWQHTDDCRPMSLPSTNVLSPYCRRTAAPYEITAPALLIASWQAVSDPARRPPKDHFTAPGRQVLLEAA